MVDSRASAAPSECDVCDQPEAVHPSPGRRILSGAEVEELRRQVLIERFNLRAQEQTSGDGQPSVNGQPSSGDDAGGA
ncbi:MAG: hypothetical protein ACREM8_00365 [Vulcanimicrobiaceae bacterium]